MNESQLWYCNICDKTIKFRNKANYIISNSHKHKKNLATLLKYMKLTTHKCTKTISTD